MTNVEKVSALCKARKTSVHKLEMDLGFGNGYIRGLKNGNIPMDRIIKIADYFKVGVGYFAADQEEEEQIFEEYRTLTHRIKGIENKLSETDRKIFEGILESLEEKYAD